MLPNQNYRLPPTAPLLKKKTVLNVKRTFFLIILVTSLFGEAYRPLCQSNRKTYYHLLTACCIPSRVTRQSVATLLTVCVYYRGPRNMTWDFSKVFCFCFCSCFLAFSGAIVVWIFACDIHLGREITAQYRWIHNTQQVLVLRCWT